MNQIDTRACLLHARSRLVISAALICLAASSVRAFGSGNGACCLSDGSCIDIPEDTCEIVGGAYQGDSTSCVDAVCVPFGACCFPDISCEILVESLCIQAGGIYRGAGGASIYSGPRSLRDFWQAIGALGTILPLLASQPTDHLP